MHYAKRILKFNQIEKDSLSKAKNQKSGQKFTFNEIKKHSVNRRDFTINKHFL